MTSGQQVPRPDVAYTHKQSLAPGLSRTSKQIPLAQEANQTHESCETHILLTPIHYSRTPGVLLLPICLLGVRATGFPALSTASTCRGPQVQTRSTCNKTQQPADWARTQLRPCWLLVTTITPDDLQTCSLENIPRSAPGDWWLFWLDQTVH